MLERSYISSSLGTPWSAFPRLDFARYFLRGETLAMSAFDSAPYSVTADIIMTVHEQVTSLKLTSYSRSPVVITTSHTFTHFPTTTPASRSFSGPFTHADEDSGGPCHCDEAAAGGEDHILIQPVFDVFGKEALNELKLVTEGGQIGQLVDLAVGGERMGRSPDSLALESKAKSPIRVFWLMSQRQRFLWMAHPHMLQQEGLMCLPAQSPEHGGDFRRLVVILGELDRAIEGPQAISKTDTCSFVQGGTG
ncbi:hypothetical protein L3Q82_008303 [Scortum barcoo]|uniref:Uncharacterized protein n=1 Tax=Scortum barcoo TaxID=214431 RepID=A0ACB8WHQ9_9TELE|nr:hypothetical protein L3Q82_008303 [Scortum barcoo]